MSDCVTRLAEARTALHAMITGKQRVTVSYLGQSVTYTPSTRHELERYVRQLEAECGDTTTAGRRGAVMFRG